MDINEIYYVYAHYRLGESIPFYIGKGHELRAWWKYDRSNWWHNVVNKCGGFDVKILLDNLKECDALCMEAMYINAYGRRDLGKGPLVNMTDGGEGSSNMSEEGKDKIRYSNRCRELKETTRIKHRNNAMGSNNNMYGRNHDEYTKEIMSEKATNRKRNKHKEITKDKMGESGSKYDYIVLSGSDSIRFKSMRSLTKYIQLYDIPKINWAILRGYPINGYSITKETKDGTPCMIMENKRGKSSKFIWKTINEYGEETYYEYPKQIADFLNTTSVKIQDFARRKHPKINGYRIYKILKTICH